MLTKSQAAFIMSADRLFDVWPKMYFWTITSVRVMHDWQYPLAWNRLARLLQDHVVTCGIRVLEPHAEHGLHYHVLLSARVSVGLMRDLANKAGFGYRGQKPWVHVCVADRGSAYYLAKYLAKRISPLYKGLRRWGMIGGFRPSRVNNIEIDSSQMRLFRSLKGEMKWSYNEASQLWSLCVYYGEILLDKREEICNDFIRDAGELCIQARAVISRCRLEYKLAGYDRLRHRNSQPQTERTE